MRRMNATDARLVLPALIEAFVHSPDTIFAVSGPLDSGRKASVEAGLAGAGVVDSAVWETAQSPELFYRALQENRGSVLVVANYNLVNPNVRQAEWYSETLTRLAAGQAVCAPVDDSDDQANTPESIHFNGKLIVITEPQPDSSTLPEYQSVDGVEFFDSLFDVHNYVHRRAEVLCRREGIEPELLREALSLMRVVCRKAPELTTCEDADTGPRLAGVLNAARSGTSAAERQFLLADEITQYLNAREQSKKGTGRSGRLGAAGQWETWDYSGFLETDGLRALVLLPSIIEWFAQSDHAVYLLACNKDGFTRALLRKAAERTAQDVLVLEPEGAAAISAALSAADGAEKRVIWIGPEEFDAAFGDDDTGSGGGSSPPPCLVAHSSLSDLVGRIVWFPETHAARHGLSVRELETLYPKLYDRLEGDPVQAIDRSVAELPTPDEILRDVIG